MLRHSLLLLLLALAGCVLGARLPMRRLVHSGKWLGRAVGRIVHGEGAVLGQFPYQVSLQYVTWDDFHIVVCDGALITTTRVLTAAHCAGGVMYAFAGIVDLDTYEGAMQKSQVLEQIYHPDYPVGFGGIYPNDIAVFTLESEFTLDDYVQTISLPSAGSIPTADSPAVMSSWGGRPSMLLWANATIIDYETCRELVDSMGVVGENFVVDTMVCTLPVTGNSGLCGGDAGNPLVQDGVVIGVGQWFHAYCATEVAPAGFTRVSAFIDFINQHL